ncbi:MAG: sulfite exporter TauE/SafE family protein, partial [Nocardioides sp.]|nr:sulfite exporter TauE/SafE family protein [Nocardioides sp.]
GAVGYRRELTGQRSRILRLASASLLGGLIGATLLLVLSPGAFEAIVPILIVLGCVLVVFQPRISAWVGRRHAAAGGLPENGAWWVWPLMFLGSVYGGYFGAAQGILYMAVMGIGIDDTLQRLNGAKNVLAALVNGVAGVVFIVVADVDWRIVALIGFGSIIGGQVGATYGRRLPTTVLRVVIVVVGLVALVAFLS